MGKELLMAVDLGTSFIKSGIYDIDGNCLAEAREAVKDERPAPGIFLQHGRDLEASVIGCIRKATQAIGKRASDVRAIAFTGQMAGFMGVDKDWNDITGWSCSLDTRYAPYAKGQLDRLSREFLEYSGTSSPLFSAKHEWFRDAFPEEAKKIAKYVMISGYIIGRLGDISTEEAVIDGSLITWTGLADVKERAWSEDICSKLDVDTAHLPRIVQSTDIVAHLSREAAAITGLCPGISLVSGAGDKIAGCVGAANLRRGGLLYEAGSFGGLSLMVNDYRPDYEKRHFDILDGCEKGDLYAHYYMPGSGLTMDWFLRNFVSEKRPLGELYREMDEKMASVPAGSDGLMAIGMLSGTVMPFDSDLRGVWMGHTLSHKAEHFYKSLSESFGYALSGAIERMEALYPDICAQSIRMIGGGARSEQTAQLLCDIIGKQFEIIDRDDPALWGCCVLAAKGIGLIDNMEKFASDHVSVRRVFEPNTDLSEKYNELKKQYQHYVETLSPLCADLIV